MPSAAVLNSQRVFLAANREAREYRRILEQRGSRLYSPSEVTASIDHYSNEVVRISQRFIHLVERLNTLAERIENLI